MNVLLRYFFIVAPTLAIIFYVAYWRKMQAEVDKTYSGYNVYRNPFGAAALWISHWGINMILLLLRRSPWRVSPEKSWFPVAETFTISEADAAPPLPTQDSWAAYWGLVHSQFNGYRWYRLYKIGTSLGSYLLFVPWRWPYKSRTPILLFEGSGNPNLIVWYFLKGLLTK